MVSKTFFLGFKKKENPLKPIRGARHCRSTSVALTDDTTMNMSLTFSFFLAPVALAGLTVFFDNLQLLPEKKFAPRFKVAKKVSIADSTFACDATYIMKGNTSDKATPSTKDVLKLNCKAPAVSGFTPTMKYSTGNEVATLEVAGSVDKASITLKGDFDVATKTKKSLSATVAYPLPEGVKAKVEVKDDKSGKIELTKDKFTLEAPIKAGFKAPSVNDLTLKVKFSKDFDM